MQHGVLRIVYHYVVSPNRPLLSPGRLVISQSDGSYTREGFWPDSRN